MLFQEAAEVAEATRIQIFGAIGFGPSLAGWFTTSIATAPATCSLAIWPLL